MGGVRYSREQWLCWVVDQRSSGLTIAEFCDSVGVTQNSFYRWRRRLIAEGESFENESETDRRHVSAFVPLTVVPSERIAIDLPCGAVIRVPIDETSIDRVLRILLSATRTAGGASC